ncbi:hypothetical protein QTN25_008162 [Entamoeba marina]
MQFFDDHSFLNQSTPFSHSAHRPASCPNQSYFDDDDELLINEEINAILTHSPLSHKLIEVTSAEVINVHLDIPRSSSSFKGKSIEMFKFM